MVCVYIYIYICTHNVHTSFEHLGPLFSAWRVAILAVRERERERETQEMRKSNKGLIRTPITIWDYSLLSRTPMLAQLQHLSIIDNHLYPGACFVYSVCMYSLLLKWAV